MRLLIVAFAFLLLCCASAYDAQRHRAVVDWYVCLTQSVVDC